MDGGMAEELAPIAVDIDFVLRCMVAIEGRGFGAVAEGCLLDHQRLLLNVDNSALKQRIAALAQDKIFKDG